MNIAFRSGPKRHRNAGRRLIGLWSCIGVLVPSVVTLGSTIQVPAQYPTIQRAIDAAVDGDVVLVKAGLYQPATTLDTLGKAITVRGEVDSSGASLVTIHGRDAITVLQCTNGEGQTRSSRT